MSILSDTWTRTMIESVSVGDMIEIFPDRPARPVVAINFRGISDRGAAYVGLEVKFGERSTIKTSVREGSTHWRLCACHALSI